MSTCCIWLVMSLHNILFKNNCWNNTVLNLIHYYFYILVSRSLISRYYSYRSIYDFESRKYMIKLWWLGISLLLFEQKNNKAENDSVALQTTLSKVTLVLNSVVCVFAVTLSACNEIEIMELETHIHQR